MTRAKPGFETPLIVVVDGENVPVAVRRSAKARRVRIRVADAGAEVVLPLRTPFRQAETIVRQHESWLVSALRRRTLHAANRPPDGQMLLRGEWTPVGAVACGLLKSETVTGEALTRALKGLARLDVMEAVTKWSRLMGLVPKSVSLRDQKTKWGACTSRGTVTFNWRLLMAPPAVLEYVVVHELAHLKELNHSPRFWAIVREHCPDYAVHKKWLRDNERFLKLDAW